MEHLDDEILDLVIVKLVKRMRGVRLCDAQHVESLNSSHKTSLDPNSLLGHNLPNLVKPSLLW